MIPGSFKGLAVTIVTGALSPMACDQAQGAVGSGEEPTAYYNPSTYSYYSSSNVTVAAATGSIVVINQQVAGAPSKNQAFHPMIKTATHGYMCQFQSEQAKVSSWSILKAVCPDSATNQVKLFIMGMAGKLSARLWTQASRLLEILLTRRAIAHSRLGPNTGRPMALSCWLKWG